MILPAINLLDKLVQWDKWLFVKINSQWTYPLFDTLLPYWRTAEFWAPLYLFLLLFTLANYKSKGAWWVLFFLCTFVACDLTGTHAFKKYLNGYVPVMIRIFICRYACYWIIAVPVLVLFRTMPLTTSGWVFSASSPFGT